MLEAIANGTPDPHHGFKLRYLNPATGALADAHDPALSPSTCQPASRRGRCAQHRRHRARVPAKVVAKPAERAVRANSTWRFQENDVFVVPSWHSLQLRADRDALLFSFSDRPVQQALGLWREERS